MTNVSLGKDVLCSTIAVSSGSRSRLAVMVLVAGLTMLGITRPSAGAPLVAGDWPVSGQNLSNTRYQAAETTIGPSNVGTLAPKWRFTTGGYVSATPAVSGGAVYFPDAAGNLFKLDARTGALIWSHQIAEYDGIAGATSRTSPAIANGMLFIGDLNVAHVMGINATTGARVWTTQLDTNPRAIITGAPIVSNGVVYFGVSGGGEDICCTFRGSIAALDAATGALKWQTYTTPPNGGQPGGYSGASVWSSTPVVDRARNSLYITTGDNHSVPASVRTCELNGGGEACNASNNYFDSVVALDLTTGTVKWATRTLPYDTFTMACYGGPGPLCPPPVGSDSDFGAGANLFQARIGGQVRSVLGAGQKNGIYRALDPATGNVLWATQVGPAGSGGGIQWGTATDGVRIYVADANWDHQPYTLTSGKTTRGGAWSALDPATGRILWQTADPQSARDTAAVTVANGVVYAGALDSVGHMYALNAATGAIKWTFPSGGSVAAGPSIANGTVYWGSGYSAQYRGTPSRTFYAFSLRGAP